MPRLAPVRISVRCSSLVVCGLLLVIPEFNSLSPRVQARFLGSRETGRCFHAGRILMNDDLGTRKGLAEIALDRVTDFVSPHEAHRGIKFDMHLNKRVDTGRPGA